jgi:hypothetical protein
VIPGKTFMIVGALALSGIVTGALMRGDEPAPAMAMASLEPKFEDRWEDPELAALMKQDRLPVKALSGTAPVAVEVAVVRTDEPKTARTTVSVRRHHRERDICSRHNMRKQITRGGKSWRCRK